ncbi:MAG: superoxide dismutase, Cu-Zn family [Acidimicrobiia bacterium]|nr:superoxide dismutase, Cu-Zn family [Acidimicrobiia bacterium]
MRAPKATILPAVLCAAALAACGSDQITAQAKPLTDATFAAPAASGAQPPAVSYSASLVPATAKATVRQEAAGTGTKVSVAVTGLTANHMYGAHVHTKPCGSQPADSGPHYQNTKDPVTPSVDGKYANSQNEVWLDFQTDDKGHASASSTVPFKFRAGEANAVVIHANHTSTEPGKSGTAGDRLACITAAFA